MSKEYRTLEVGECIAPGDEVLVGGVWIKTAQWGQNVKLGSEFRRANSDQQPSALDVQTGGSHYKDMAIQPAEFIHKNGLGFLEGNVIKYTCRHKKKNGREDLEKAKHYIDLLIEMEYPNK